MTFFTKTTCISAAFLFLSFYVAAQEKEITGKVFDTNNLPLPGVNVVVKGTTSGTQTNFEGQYSISAEEGATLVFSFIGLPI